METTQPPPQQDTMSHTPYLYLGQGLGGVYSLPCPSKDMDGNDHHVQHIGTYGCMTCVCVYIPIDKDQCFAAHIDAHTGPKGSTQDWVTQSPAEAISLKTHVLQRLTAALPSLAHGEYARNALRSNAIIVCPLREIYLNGAFVMRATGWTVIEAIREFFGFSPGSHPTAFAHGFVVDHGTGRRQMLKWEDPTVNEGILARWDQLRSKGEEYKVERDDEEMAQHAVRLRHQWPTDFGFEKCSGAEERPGEWTLRYDRERKVWI